MTYLVALAVFEFISFFAINQQLTGNIRIYRKNAYVFMELLLAGLLFSQMIMYRAGSNISPYAYAHGMLEHITIAGRTYSSWLTVVFAAYCLWVIVKRLPVQRLPKGDVLMLLLILMVILFGMMGQGSVSTALTEGLKLALPFLTYRALRSVRPGPGKKTLARLMDYSNAVLLLQVIVCKAVTGKFAASQYYLEMRQEYFGFYNHPHNFTGLLGIFVIWCVFNINQKKTPVKYMVMAAMDLGLMYFSGSRSYVYSVILAVAYILLVSFFDKKLKRMRKYAAMAAAFAVMFGGFFLSHLGAGRVTGSFLSGREERWLGDIEYFVSRTSLMQKLLGGGFGFVNEVNRTLFNVYINSLNIVIDVLLNSGVIGALFILIAYGILFRFYIKSGNKPFTFMTLIYFFVSSMVTNLISYQVITVYMIVMLSAMIPEERYE